ncbi:MAG: sigma-70 family RNA polymerase sigma factor [Planctomycetota bacterium]|nr:MAG: sigma-70 family RNA polymerase sigma factor [Planctomycetota bacterium]
MPQNATQSAKNLSPRGRSDLVERAVQGASGDPRAVCELVPMFYAELRRLAARHLAGERNGHTLQPTALVHEAFLKLAGPQGAARIDPKRFVAFASRVMRQVLVTHATRRAAAKRGGGAMRRREPLDALADAFTDRCSSLAALDESLNLLAERDPLAAQIVELRFFGGLTTDRIAEVLRMSPRTIEREWQVARAFLRSRVEPPNG